MTTDPEKRLTLAVIIPCYNERSSIEQALQRVLDVGLADEIIVVDDGSTDGTRDILARIADAGHPGLQVLLMERNQGKGAALRRASRPPARTCCWSRTRTWSTTRATTRCY